MEQLKHSQPRRIYTKRILQAKRRGEKSWNQEQDSGLKLGLIITYVKC